MSGMGSLLFKKKESPYAQIPLLFFPDEEWGYVEATIEGKKRRLFVDLGGGHEFYLLDDAIADLKRKEKTSENTFFDLNGKEYSSSSFVVDPIQVGKLTISQIEIRQEPLEFHLSGGILGTPDSLPSFTPHDGRIGAQFFRTWPFWYIDFQKGAIYALRNFQSIAKTPSFPPRPWVEADLEPLEPQFAISVETPFGKHRFVLDSGSEISLLRTPDGFAPGRVAVSFFKIGDHDFGETRFTLYPISEKCDGFDGILGLDFLKQHPFYLDLERKKVFFVEGNESALRG